MQLPHGWQVTKWTNWTCRYSATIFGKFAFLSLRDLSTLIRATLSPPLCSFPLSTFSVLLPLSFSWNLPTSVSVLSFFSPILLRESGHQAAAASLHSACEAVFPLAGSGSPWCVTSRDGRGSPHSIQMSARHALPDLTFMRVIEVQTSYLVVAVSPTVPIFSPLFPATMRSSPGNGLKWQISLYWCMHRWVSAFGFRSQRQHTTVWFLGLITSVRSGQDARSSIGPFWKHTGWYLNRYPQGMGWKVNLSLSLFQSFLSLLPLPPPWSSHLHSCPLYPKNFLSVSLCFVIGIFLCDVVLSVQLLLLVYADIAGAVEHLSLEIQMQCTLLETPALAYLVEF